MTASAEATWRAFMGTPPRGVHGTVVYDLAEFGLDPAEIARGCAFYTECFGIVPETR